MRKREVAELAAEMVLVLSGSSGREIPERKGNDFTQVNKETVVKDCWKQIFAAAEQRRPLLLECKG